MKLLLSSVLIGLIVMALPQVVNAQEETIIRPVSFEEGLKLHKETGKPLLIQYSASWCPPCRQLTHELTQLVKTRDDFIWAYVDTDKRPTEGVGRIPHISILVDGNMVYNQSGYLTQKQLLRKMKLEDQPKVELEFGGGKGFNLEIK